MPRRDRHGLASQVTLASDLPSRFSLCSTLLRDARDIVAERPVFDPPRWAVARGWEPFLTGLSDDALAVLEREGLAVHAGRRSGLPNDLQQLAVDVLRAVTFVAAVPVESAGVSAQRASLRKRSQVGSFAALLRDLLPRAARVVDIGSGHGHLTRHLARQLDVPVEGWELDAARIAVASRLPGASGTSFRSVDANAASGELRPDDLVIGLHACGELADNAVRAAAKAGAAVALVGCCLQKRRGDREALSTGDPRDLLSRDVLGLGNVVLGDRGVEEPLAVRLRSRENRIALRLLLEDVGLTTAPGEEMRGLNRRRAVGGLDELAAAAFALRGVAPPRKAALRDVGPRASALHARLRRWDLPRGMLGRVIEVWVAEDRAAHLAGSERRAAVVLAFDAAESPRNLAVIAPLPAR